MKRRSFLATCLASIPALLLPRRKDEIEAHAPKPDRDGIMAYIEIPAGTRVAAMWNGDAWMVLEPIYYPVRVLCHGEE